MLFIFHSADPDEREIGITRGIPDAHGRAMVPPRVVHPNDPAAARRITSGEAFEVDEHADPVLAGFLRIDPRFQTLRK